MAITAEMVKALREKTGLPMMDCKKALSESGGNEAEAIAWLRRHGLVRSERMADRVASEGRIACYVSPDGTRGGIAELRCETAPVASTPDFIRLAEAAAQIAAHQDDPTPESVLAARLPGSSGHTVADELGDVFNRIREKMQLARVASLRGQVGHYVHHNAQVGVLVSLSAPSPPELKTDVCMHIAALRPRCVRREEVPPEEIETERRLAAEAARGKPPQVIEKIVSGKLDRWFSEFVLLEQPFVKDDKRSVAAVLAGVSPGLTVQRFLRYAVGGA
jgi:elongation factor Ts